MPGTAFRVFAQMASGALLLGRRTYEGFAEAWPSRTDEDGFADRMNGLPKFVVSLVDELRLRIHPVVPECGKRLFEDVDRMALKLAETRTLNAGVVIPLVGKRSNLR
ncbi:dihydrofolate reductase family protein [Cohnella zeiphila]|uniref:dihydrofolate reductase family protein n=1 Tax=Cohnella zeiphila TaxID=2761120 RepID=UPI001EE35883|nr:hypothetical protein [Cohnella zeiphila]